MDHDERLSKISDARQAVFRAMGTMSEDVLAPIIGPALTGGPPWPTRPAWRMIDRGDTLVLSSDALSDPWDDDEENDAAGYELEVFMEAPRNLFPDVRAITDLAPTWLFAAVSEVSSTLARHGGGRALVDELGTVSVEVDGERFPPELRNADGRVGVLIGVSARGVPSHIDYGSLGDARFLALTVLTPTELERIVDEGEEARNAIAAGLAASPTGHVSVLSRPSV